MVFSRSTAEWMDLEVCKQAKQRNMASRISKVSTSETPYPFVVEFFRKSEEPDIWDYRTGDAFKTLEEAKNYQNLPPLFE